MQCNVGQGHLKATLQSDDFYKNASNIKEWEAFHAAQCSSTFCLVHVQTQPFMGSSGLSTTNRVILLAVASGSARTEISWSLLTPSAKKLDKGQTQSSNPAILQVIELHVSGLPHDADDMPTPFRRYCHSPKCQGIAWRTASLHLRTAQLHDEERRVHETKVDKTWLVDTQFLHVSLTFATPGFSNFSFPGKCKSNPRNNVFGRLASVSLQTHVNLMQWISEAFPLGPNGSVRPSLAPFAS